MCRLFGFRSVITSRLHRSLLDAENALGTQSERHPDGWGVAYYVDGAPHVVRSAETALTDHIFRRVSGVVASETVIAHVRKATAGGNHVLNSHPFQYGRWVFAHNGEIPEFDRVRSALVGQLSPHLRGFLLGETDSELLFMLFVDALSRRDPRLPSVGAALAEVEARVERACRGTVDPDRLLLNFLVTDGACLVASRRGKELYWSTYKTACSERETCRSYAPECEHPTVHGRVNHLVVSSEPIGGENVWHALPDRHAAAVDAGMQLSVAPLAELGRRARLQVAS